MSVGGVKGVPQQTAPVSAPAPSAPAAPKTTVTKPKLDAKQFGILKTQVKLPMTNVNALTQMSSKDQMKLMKLGQDNSQTFVGKLAQNLQNARTSIQTDVLPKSLIGAGQTIPPAAMRAMAACTGHVFTGRMFDIQVGKETTTMSFRISGKSFNITINSPKKKGSKYKSEEEVDEDLLEDDVEESL